MGPEEEHLRRLDATQLLEPTWNNTQALFLIALAIVAIGLLLAHGRRR